MNAVIRQNTDVSTRLMPTDKAIEAGAEALFGEKYGDEVRVLTMGEDSKRATSPISVELCGGTHVRRLGDIGLFTILSESAVASGVRRIEALTSEGARRYLSHQAELAREAAAALKTKPGGIARARAAAVRRASPARARIGRCAQALALAGPAEGHRRAKAAQEIARPQDGVARGGRRGAERPQRPRRRSQGEDRLGRGGVRGRGRRQSLARGRRHRRSEIRGSAPSIWCGRRRSAGRQRRRRTARHGASRRPDGDKAGAALEAIAETSSPHWPTA